MMNFKVLLTAMACIALDFFGFGQTHKADPFAELRTTPWEDVKPAEITADPGNDRKPATALIIPESIIWKWYENEPEAIVLRLPGYKSIRLHRVNICNTVVTTSTGDQYRGKQFTGVHYQTRQGIGAVTIFKRFLMAVIEYDGDVYNLGLDLDNPKRYLLVKDSDLGVKHWDCHALDDGLLTPIQKNDRVQNSVFAISCKTVQIGFEADSIMYAANGRSVTTTSNFISGVFNVVNQIYRNEGILLRLGSVFIHTRRDPYIGFTDAFSVLYNFNLNRPVSGFGTDHLRHLLSTRSPSLGGMAYTNVLCNPSARHAFSSIWNSYAQLPNYSWTVSCIGHEIGHNFGSRHTHWCGWSLPNGTTGRIDSCWSGEGGCGTTTRPRRGTIMSYCHVTSGGIDLTLGFGPLPGKVIRDNLAASCIPSVQTADCGGGSTACIFTYSSWSTCTNGTQTRTFTSAPSGCTGSPPADSLSRSCTVPTDNSCTADGLMLFQGSDGKWRFRFGLRPKCNTYTVFICSYTGFTNSAVQPAAGTTPTSCGIRNGMNNYTPTAAERTAGFIERVADPQPWAALGLAPSCWYSVDVVCNNSAGCTTPNRTRSFAFVQRP